MAALLHGKAPEFLLARSWTDWLTNSFFRVRVAPAASEKLGRLSAGTQGRLRQMLQDITELADLTAPNMSQSWMSGAAPMLLTLRLGRVIIRYSISEENRTLTIHHITGEDDEEPLGETG
jgi:hypothetical protein